MLEGEEPISIWPIYPSGSATWIYFVSRRRFTPAHDQHTRQKHSQTFPPIIISIFVMENTNSNEMKSRSDVL